MSLLEHDTTERLDSASFFINPHLTVVRCTDDEILVRRGSRSTFSKIVKDTETRQILSDLVDAMRTATTEAELVARFAHRVGMDDVTAVLDQLRDEKIVIDTRAHLPALYLETQAAAHRQRGETGDATSGRATPEAHGLASVTVGIAGCGPIGVQIAIQLRSLGAGDFVIADGRTTGVEMTAPLADAMLASLDPTGDANVTVLDGSIDDGEVLAELFDSSDIVVVAIEGFRPTLFQTANDLSLATGRPWLAVHADGDEAIIGPLVVPGESPCYNEFEIQHEAARVLRTEYLLYREEVAAAALPSVADLPPPVAALAASYAVLGLAPFITTSDSFLVGRVVRFDTERLELLSERLLRIPRCPSCAAANADFRHPFL